VLKRCIYGVDLNEMAVELARLGLWLHSLVPGLPLSYLGANLVHGNSLVGVGADVTKAGLFAKPHEDRAAAAAAAVESITDLELGDIERSEALQEELQHETSGLSAYYDALTAGPLVDQDMAILDLHAEEIIEGHLEAKYSAQLAVARKAAAAQCALHWRLAFPSVFLRRDSPGFDVILGNPPWEETRI
jgi:hypothetical protein